MADESKYNSMGPNPNDINAYKSVKEEIDGIFSGLNAITDEINKQTQGYKLALSSIKHLTTVFGKVKDFQDGIHKANSKDLQVLKAKLESEKKNLETSRRLLQIKYDENTATDRELATLLNINGVLEQQQGLFDHINKTLKQHIANESIVEQKTGNLGVLVDGFSKGLNKMGLGSLETKLNLGGALENTKAMVRANGGNVSQFKSISHLSGQLGPNLLKGAGPAAAIALILQELINAFKFIDGSSGEMAKNFGTSYGEAVKLNTQLTKTAGTTNNIFITTKNLQEAYSDINNAFGTFASLNDETLITYTKLTKQIGLSKEASLTLVKTSLLTNKSLERVTKEYMSQAKLMSIQKGISLNQKQLQEGISKISSSTTLSLKAQPEALAKAVVNAKALGVEIDQVEKIAESLLSFENSIENEMAAELLTGKKINLERARLAALNGDIATVAEEIAKQIGNANEFSKMNVIQQEALAKSVGMTREELAKSLIEREAMAKIGVKDAAAAKEKFDLLVKQYGYEKASKMLGDEQYAQQLKSASIQERFNQLIEKLRENFVMIVEPIIQMLDPILNLYQSLQGMNMGMVQMKAMFEAIGEILAPLTDGFKEIEKTINEMMGGENGMGGMKDIIMEVGTTFYKMVYLPIVAVGKAIMTAVIEPLKGAMSIFKGISDVVSGITNGDWGKVTDGLKSIGEGMLRIVLAPIQAILTGVITLVNGMTGALNSVTGLIGIGKIPKIPNINLVDQIVGDGIAPSNKGPFTITDKYGSTAMTSHGDNLAVSPNLSKGGDMAAASELKEIKILLTKLLEKEGTVNIDGNKVGQALSLASYKVQ
jgi:hypothetical protein